MTIGNSLEDFEVPIRIMSNFRNIDLSRFDDRLYLQKLGYLIQKIQQDNASSFSWYIRGPYSSTLASTLFLHEEKGTYKKPAKLSELEVKTKKTLHELFGKKIKNPLSLELYASLWYLMSGSKISLKEKEGILYIMRKEKPYFRKKEIEVALDKLSKFRAKHSL